MCPWIDLDQLQRSCESEPVVAAHGSSCVCYTLLFRSWIGLRFDTNTELFALRPLSGSTGQSVLEHQDQPRHRQVYGIHGVLNPRGHIRYFREVNILDR